MHHLNAELKKNGTGLHLLLGLISPELYVATTIDDFLQNRSDVRPTKKILPFGVFYFNASLVLFPSVRYNSINEREGKLSDMNSSLEVFVDIPYPLLYKCISEVEELEENESVPKLSEFLWKLENRAFEKRRARYPLTDGMRLYNAWIKYYPNSGDKWLLFFKAHGPETRDKKRSLFDTAHDLAYSPARI